MGIQHNFISHKSLRLPRCPHCRVAEPNLSSVHSFDSKSSNHVNFHWRVYVCSSCGYPVLGGCRAGSGSGENDITYIYPAPDVLQDGFPAKAGALTRQAMESVHAPSGAIMLCASAVDAMLKEKGLKTGGLYARIEQAADQHLITAEMSAWAHDIRLDANDERHADDNAVLPTTEDAKKCIDFVRALGDFMFVLPLRVERGRAGAKLGTQKV